MSAQNDVMGRQIACQIGHLPTDERRYHLDMLERSNRPLYDIVRYHLAVGGYMPTESTNED